MSNIIEVNNITKSFKEEVVLKDINLNFKRGKIYGLVGRNGSGKTMLLKCICGLERVSKGTISVEGKIVGKDPLSTKNIGAIIETPGFLPNYSGYKNLMFLASINNKISKDDIIQTLELVGLDPKMRKWVGKYSLGMRQRLGIAQAIMEKPSILLLDEPMNGLDFHAIKEMRALFSELREQGITIIIATHVEDDINQLCEEVIYMSNGMVEYGGRDCTAGGADDFLDLISLGSD